MTNDIQHVTQPSAANSSSNFIATSNQSLLLSNQYVHVSNDDDIIVSETSINEEPDNLSIDIVDDWSIDVIEYLDSSANDSLQQRVGDVIRKCRSIVKLINRSSILMNYVLILKKQFNIHRSLQLGCKSRWNSSYHLIKAMLMYKMIINKINSEKYEIGLNEKQTTKLSSIELDQDDWKMLETTEFVLRRIVYATHIISGSKYSTVGISYIAIVQIREFLQDVKDFSVNDSKILH